ncbi:hypothetical protein LXA43DRAFT_1094562 [Ganoderma leucocontextum]|nr:hypothetical protein LXA43DRAFT_1094562 [Ganoderma leucocontextum]
MAPGTRLGLLLRAKLTHYNTEMTTAKPGQKVMGKRQDCDPPRGVHGGSVTALSCSANGKDGAENVPLQGDAGYGDPVSRRAFSRDNVYRASASHHQARPVPLSVDV